MVRISFLMCGVLWVVGGAVAEASEPLPVNAPVRATVLGGGIVAPEGQLQARCCAPAALRVAVPLPAQPLAGAIGEPQRVGAGPLAAVRAMLRAFGAKSGPGFVGMMSEDFVFDSDDPEFRARYPNGMTREDERSFAERLFQGGGRGPDGQPLPVATRVYISVGPMTVEPFDPTRAPARVVLKHLDARIELSDGSVLELGDADHTMDLVLTEAGWRVRRWHERRASPLTQAHQDRSDSTASAGGERDPAEGELPARLALAARVDRANRAMVFDLALPRAGGELELFDVMGRRVARHDLAEARRGHHTLTLDGGRFRAGVYWARLRQDDVAATAKLVWAR